MKKKIFTGLFIALVIVVLAIVLVLNYGYSSGNRTGKLVKLSKVGYLLKTYEGTLDLGSGDELTWQFSVHKDKVGDELMQQTGKQIRLHYKEHLFNLFYKSKYNVESWEHHRDGETDFLCRFVEVIRSRPDVVAVLRPMLQEKDQELLREVKKCQALIKKANKQN
ncbi:MAG: hypothetical protein KAG61_04500 [Bacteriovoracaceae bacterium]|nr:hypothetical protein [Bacteriovoracaceae bacterium]